MTSTRQIAANRENAKQSTGPRTRVGKENSLKNSIRHGARGTPSAQQVLTWFRLIAEDESVTLLSADYDPILHAGLMLAEAEARLANVRSAEYCLAERIYARAADGNINTMPDPRSRLLLRYRREAEAHRSKALKFWLEKQENPNEANRVT